MPKIGIFSAYKVIFSLQGFLENYVQIIKDTWNDKRVINCLPNDTKNVT